MSRKVLIVGAGMGGLSAAHELVQMNAHLPEGEEPFEIHVLEATSVAGGKSASQRVGGGYLGEHGFRFFPQFYRHVMQTLGQIPTLPRADKSSGKVLDSLKQNPHALVLLKKGDNEYATYRLPRGSLGEDWVDDLFAYYRLFRDADVSGWDGLHIAVRTLAFAASCQRRRDTEYDAMSWYDFQQLDNVSEQARRILAAVSENLSAMRAIDSSARTIGTISLQMAFNFNGENNPLVDAALPAPTTDAWIDPWMTWLKSQGVHFEFDASVRGLTVDKHEERVAEVLVDAAGQERTESPDFVVLAVPLERVAALVDDDLALWDEALGKLRDSPLLRKMLGDMAGVQFYLSRPLPKHAGAHAAYPDSPWKLTTVAQGQLWDIDLEHYDIPELKEVLSVIVSQWDEPFDGTRAQDCASPEEFARKTFEQIRRGWDLSWERDVLAYHVDEHLSFEPDRLPPFVNHTPLLIHPIGSRHVRPEASVRAHNLFLAADFVRTHTDLASMEAANEAARRAITGVAEAAGVSKGVPRPNVYELTEWQVFRWLQRIDDWLYREGKANLFDMNLPELKAVLAEYQAAQHPLPGWSGADDPVEGLIKDLISEAPTPRLGAPRSMDDRTADALFDALVATLKRFADKAETADEATAGNEGR